MLSRNELSDCKKAKQENPDIEYQNIEDMHYVEKNEFIKKLKVKFGSVAVGLPVYEYSDGTLINDIVSDDCDNGKCDL